jgi:hypothetical protein
MWNRAGMEAGMEEGKLTDKGSLLSIEEHIHMYAV